MAWDQINGKQKLKGTQTVTISESMKKKVAWCLGISLALAIPAATGVMTASAEEFGDAIVLIDETCPDCEPALDTAGDDSSSSEGADSEPVAEATSEEVERTADDAALPTEEEQDQDDSAVSVPEDIEGTSPGVETADKPTKTTQKEDSEEHSVTVAETGEKYATLTEAIAGAESDGKTSFTLKVTGDVVETTEVVVKSNVTIVGAQGSHTITFNIPAISGLDLSVQGGGHLTLGSGSTENLLTIRNNVSVRNGSILVRDGVAVRAGSDAITLSGPNATGKITGGSFAGGDTGALVLDGASLSEISGGYFTGSLNAIQISGAGSEIGTISGGKFFQPDATTTLNGHALFIDNSAVIGEISGGDFEATKLSALGITRAAWIDRISGGTFFSHRVGVYNADPTKDTRNGTVWIEGDTARTGIGTISGGHFSGAYFGVLLLVRKTEARVDSITGGSLNGVVGLQNDRGSSIGTITGGTMSGTNQGMLNVGKIDRIGGTAEFRGGTGGGISNYPTGRIGEISSGLITSTASSAISNQGTIDLISGGQIIGFQAAINCTGAGTLGTIKDGVFWGMGFAAIYLVRPLKLEPGLRALEGAGRYWGKNGAVFGSETNVQYPSNLKAAAAYKMSTETADVVGIDETSFRYLMFDFPPLFHRVTVVDSFAEESGAGGYFLDETVIVESGSRDGYTFAGWTTADNIVLDDPAQTEPSFTMPDNDVTVTALWEAISTEEPATEYTVTVKDSHAAITGAGAYASESLVTINAGTRSGYTFEGWTTSNDVAFASASTPTTTFTMPASDVTVTANWKAVSIDPPKPATEYTVTVNESHAETTGAGTYASASTVTVNAGSRSGYTFEGWTTSDGVVFASADSATTTFAMPAKNVTVTANWTVANETLSKTTHAVKVKESHAREPGTGSYQKDSTVKIDAESRTGYTFSGWTTKDGVTLANAKSSPTTFTMPGKDVTVTATWTRVAQGGLASTGSDSVIALLTLALMMTMGGVLTLLQWRKRKHTNGTH